MYDWWISGGRAGVFPSDSQNDFKWSRENKGGDYLT
jgi:hypothetical protein